MRILLSLRPQQQSTRVPLNYAYPLSAAIYRILQQASGEYASFLHDRGYEAASGRLMKLFTFSKLWIPGVRRDGGTLRGTQECWKLQVGSPMHDEFVRNFVLGIFESSGIIIASRGHRAEFLVEEVQSLARPEFGEVTRCKCLSPIVVSTMLEKDGRLLPYYYRPHDEGISMAIRNNLLEKYGILHGGEPADDRFVFRLDPAAKPKSKLIKLKEGTREETHIKAFESHFIMEGSTELMQTAWECGIGEHTSQGFGMVDVVT
jgi:CRISPR-associated endoribonuclease Cas6